MPEHGTELLSRNVVKRHRDGRRRFDPHAKRALIEASLRPGVSVARLALDHGINANLLRKWISRHKLAQGEAVPMAAGTPSSVPAFVPVAAIRAPEVRSAFRVRAKLHNGVEVDLGEASADELSSILQLLNRLPCSGSTPD
jgi:transposase